MPATAVIAGALIAQIALAGPASAQPDDETSIEPQGTEIVNPDLIDWVGEIEADGSIRLYDEEERNEHNEEFAKEQEELLEAEDTDGLPSVSPFASATCTSKNYRVTARYPAEGPAWRYFCYAGYGNTSVVAMHTDVLGVCPGTYRGRIYVHFKNGTKQWSPWRGAHPNNSSTYCYNFGVPARTFDKVQLWNPANGPTPV